MALTKAHIVEMIAEQNGFSKNKNVEIVENLIEIIKGTLEAGDDVLVSGFGKFCLKSKGSRRGRNPATGSDLMMSARKVETFKCSGKFRDKLNPVIKLRSSMTRCGCPSLQPRWLPPSANSRILPSGIS